MTTPTIKSLTEDLELYSDESPFSLSLRINNFDSEGDYVKFIRNCERHIRSSLEYKLWKNYLIDILGITTCMITNERMDQCTVEVHHHIPSLFTLVQSLVNKKIEDEEKFCTFDVSLEAMEMHFLNKVGYVVLVKTLHEKFHNGFLTIPIQYVKGDYHYFLENYSKYLEDDELDKINMRLSINESNCSWTKDNYPGMDLDDASFG